MKTMNTSCPLLDMVDRVSWSLSFSCVYSVVPFYYNRHVKGYRIIITNNEKTWTLLNGYQWPVRGEHNNHTEHVIIIMYCLGTRIVSEITVNKS